MHYAHMIDRFSWIKLHLGEAVINLCVWWILGTKVTPHTYIDSSILCYSADQFGKQAHSPVYLVLTTFVCVSGVCVSEIHYIPSDERETHFDLIVIFLVNLAL